MCCCVQVGHLVAFSNHGCWWLFPITDAGGCKNYWIVNQYFHSDLKLQKLADFSRWLAVGTTTADNFCVRRDTDPGGVEAGGSVVRGKIRRFFLSIGIS